MWSALTDSRKMGAARLDEMMVTLLRYSARTEAYVKHEKEFNVMKPKLDAALSRSFAANKAKGVKTERWLASHKDGLIKQSWIKSWRQNRTGRS